MQNASAYTPKAQVSQTPVKSISQDSESVNSEFSEDEKAYSDRDSEGNELTAEQQKFFKDSKVRDKKGNLISSSFLLVSMTEACFCFAVARTLWAKHQFIVKNRRKIGAEFRAKLL